MEKLILINLIIYYYINILKIKLIIYKFFIQYYFIKILLF